jgi:hypothetical protein
MSTKKDYYELLSFEEKSMWEQEYNIQNTLNIDVKVFLSTPCTSFQQFLAQSFVFDISKKGWDYWFDMSRSNRSLPEWVNVYYNNVDITNGDELVVFKNCRSFRLPLQESDAIAEDLLLQNLITSFVIEKPNSKNIKFE